MIIEQYEHFVKWSMQALKMMTDSSGLLHDHQQSYYALNPVLTTCSDIVIEHIDFYVSVHARNMPHKSSSAWRPPRLSVHHRASVCMHQSRAPCKQGFTLQSRRSIRSIGHRYWLSAMSLLRYRISVVPKLSISVWHYFLSPFVTCIVTTEDVNSRPDNWPTWSGSEPHSSTKPAWTLWLHSWVVLESFRVDTFCSEEVFEVTKTVKNRPTLPTL